MPRPSDCPQMRPSIHLLRIYRQSHPKLLLFSLQPTCQQISLPKNMNQYSRHYPILQSSPPSEVIIVSIILIVLLLAPSFLVLSSSVLRIFMISHLPSIAELTRNPSKPVLSQINLFWVFLHWHRFFWALPSIHLLLSKSPSSPESSKHF